MTHSFVSPRAALGLLSTAALFVGAVKSDAASIQLTPLLPMPGDSVNMVIEVAPCVRFERWEKAANRIVVYTRRANFSFCPGGDTTSIALGELNPGFYSIEVFERSVDAVAPPDGYSKRAERRFSVALGKPNVGKPTQSVLLGSMTIVQEYRSGTEVTFSVKDAAGVGVPDAPLGFSTASAGAPSFVRSCGVFAISPDCPAYQTAANGAITIFGSSSGDAEGAVVTTITATTMIDNRAQNAYATIGYIDALRRDSVLPIVEYEIDTSVIAPPTRYFLSADNATSLVLDNTPNAFRRTYAAFFGVKPNTPGTVPVCRFFANGKTGPSLTHIFTADSVECAAKKVDARYSDEGVAFWAYPASASGACPAATRGVTRYVLTSASNASNTSLRYSTLLSMKSRAAIAEPNGNDVTVKNDGVAFCVPD